MASIQPRSPRMDENNELNEENIKQEVERMNYQIQRISREMRDFLKSLDVKVSIDKGAEVLENLNRLAMFETDMSNLAYYIRMGNE